MQKIIWIVIILLFTIGVNSTSIAKKYKFKDDNFSIKLDKSWEHNKESGISAGHFFYAKDQGYGLIIRKLPSILLTDSTFPTNKQEYIEFIRNNYLQKQIEKVTQMMSNYFSIEPIKISGYDGFLVNVRYGKSDNLKTLAITIIVHNNNAYLFSIISTSSDLLTTNEVQKITRKFKILDTEKTNEDVIFEFTAKNTYSKSHYYGYELPDFKNMIKATNADLNLKEDESMFNNILIHSKHGYVTSISSICNIEKSLTDKKLLDYFITGQTEEVLEPFKTRLDKTGKVYASGKLYNKDLKVMVYYYRVVSIENCKHVVMLYSNIDKSVAPLDDFISHIKAIPINNALLPIKEVNEENIRQALILNSIGIHAIKEDTHLSYKLFKQAFKLEKTNPIYLDNFLTIAYGLKKFNEALKVLNSSEKTIIEDQQFIRWKAALLAQTENISQAIETYEGLFSNGYTNDEQYFEYLQLLANNNLWQKMLDSMKQNKSHVSKQKSLKLKRAYAYAKISNTDKVNEILQEITLSDNFNDYDFYSLLDVYAEIKAFEEGIKLINNHIETKEKNANIYYYLGDFQYAINKPRDSLKSMQKALEYQPSNQTILNYINGLNSIIGIGDINITKTEITAIALPQSIKDDISKIKLNNKSEPVEHYYYISAYKYKKNKKRITSLYKKYRINDLQSLAGIETVQFKFNQEYEHPYINKFVVTNLNTKVITELDRDSIYITSVNDDIHADGDKYLNIPIPSIGDNIEVEYIISTQSNHEVSVFSFETEYFVSNRHYQYMATFIRGDINDIDTNKTSRIKVKKSKNLIVWSSRNIEKYKNEALIPETHKQFEWVEMASVEKNWKILGDIYLSKINEKLDSNLSKGQLLSILPDSRDPISVSKDLSQYVQSNVTYQALEFGYRAQIPNTTSQTLQKKYGDCKDHAVVLYDLLKKKGIKANLALVSTRKYVSEDLITLDQFDHMIVYLPNINGGVFVDATDKYTVIDLKTPPRSVQGSIALVLEKGKSKLIPIPKLDSKQNTLSIERVVSQTPESFIFNETAVISGYIATDFRSYIQPLNKEHINSDILKWVNGIYPNLGLLEFKYYNLNTLDKPLVLEFKFEQNKSVNDFNVPAFLERVYLSYSSDDNRVYPYEFTESFEIHSITTSDDEALQLPLLKESYRADSFNWSINSQQGQKFDATIKSGTYQAIDYKAFVDATKVALYKIEKSILIKE